MKKYQCCFFVYLVFAGSCRQANLSEEEEQIRELWTTASTSVCNGDWENYAKTWAHAFHIQVMHPDAGEWLTGWEQIREKYETLLRSGMKCTLPKNELKVNVSPSGEMAWGTVDCIIQFNDSTGTRVHFWETCVFEKIGGEWKMVLGMASVPRDH